MPEATELFGYYPLGSIEERLRPWRLEIERCVSGDGDRLLEASVRVSLAEEILSIERHDSSQVSIGDVSDALNQLICAARIYDEYDRPLDGWRQRAKALSVLQEFGRDELRFRFFERIDILKEQMEKFAEDIPSYRSSVGGEVPRYISVQREVLETNYKLRVGDRGGDAATSDSAQIGV